MFILNAEEARQVSIKRKRKGYNRALDDCMNKIAVAAGEGKRSASVEICELFVEIDQNLNRVVEKANSIMIEELVADLLKLGYECMAKKRESTKMDSWILTMGW